MGCNCFGGRIAIWSLSMAKCIQKMESPWYSVTFVQFMVDQQLVAIGKSNGIELWSTMEPQMVKVIDSHEGNDGLTFAFNEDFFVSSSSDQTIRVREMKTWSVVQIIENVAAEQILFINKMEFLTVQRGTLKVWKVT